MTDPDPDAVALSWWTALPPKDRVRYRQRIHAGNDVLLFPHAHDLAAAGLQPPGWSTAEPGAPAPANDLTHRAELVFGLDRHHRMPDPVRRLIRTDLDRTALTGSDLAPRPRWWHRRPTNSR